MIVEFTIMLSGTGHSFLEKILTDCLLIVGVFDTERSDQITGEESGGIPRGDCPRHW